LLGYAQGCDNLVTTLLCDNMVVATLGFLYGIEQFSIQPHLLCNEIICREFVCWTILCYVPTLFHYLE